MWGAAWLACAGRRPPVPRPPVPSGYGIALVSDTMDFILRAPWRHTDGRGPSIRNFCVSKTTSGLAGGARAWG